MAESDKDRADRLDAQDRLIARGYKREECRACKGIGTHPPTDRPCLSCDGRGFHWQAPITKCIVEEPLAVVPTPESDMDDFWGFGG